MSTLRWILLIFGILLIAGIYLLGRRREGRLRIRREPALEDDLQAAVRSRRDPIDPALAEETLTAETSALNPVESTADEALEDADWLDFESLIKESVPVPASPKLSQKTSPKPSPPASRPKSARSGSSMLLDDDLVVLHAFAREPGHIDGIELYALMEEHGYVRGRHDIFYKRNSNDACMVANAFKPGTFPEAPEEFETRGVSLILQLSKTDRPLESFEEVLSLAHSFQEKLDCRLYDSQRSSLTRQTITYLHDEIQQYQFRHQLL